jgi:branched-chain amino acid transport system permease protein
MMIITAPLFITSKYTMHLLIMVGVYILLTQALNLLVGYMGLLSLGNHAYILIGGYAAAMLGLKLGLSFWISLPLAIVITGLLGLAIGYVTLRLRGAYFVIVTIGFAEIARLVTMNIDALGGPPGLRGIPAPIIHIGNLINYSFGRGKVPYYYLIWGMALLGILISYRIVNARQGRAFLAMRENEPLAQSIGINAFHYANLAFLVNVCLTGAAGAFLAVYISHVSPEIGAFHWTVATLLMVVIGGQGTIIGPIIGSFLFTFLPEWLRVAEQYRLPIYGLILVLAVLFFPQGIVHELTRLRDWIQERRGKGSVQMSDGHNRVDISPQMDPPASESKRSRPDQRGL